MVNRWIDFKQAEDVVGRQHTQYCSHLGIMYLDSYTKIVINSLHLLRSRYSVN
jgi:hypothetical protein